MRIFQVDHARVSEAIGAAEKRTSGEIICVVAQVAGAYRRTPYVWALLATVAASAAWVGQMMFGWQAGHAAAVGMNEVMGLFVCQLVTFGVVFSLVNLPGVRVMLTPRRVKHATARRLARQQFLARGLHLTRERTGVLVFVAVAEHYAEIIADEAIDKKVKAGVWRETLDVLLENIRKGEPTEGFVAAVGMCAGLLAKHFPHKKGTANQVPNIIVEI